MTRNSGDPLDVENPFSWYFFPLRNGLGSYAPNGFREGGRATGYFFCEVTCFFHMPIESITFRQKQAHLSVKVTI